MVLSDIARSRSAQSPTEGLLSSHRITSCHPATLLILKTAMMPWAISALTTMRRSDTTAKRVACTCSDRHCETTVGKRVASGEWRKGSAELKVGLGVLVCWLTKLDDDRRFPPARVWPSIEPGNHRRRIRVEDYGVRLPSKERQAFLLQIFFIHVNTLLPLFIEEPFMEAWHRSVDDLYVNLVYSTQSVT